jgi:putative membrane protein
MMGWYGDGLGWGGWLMMTLVMLPIWVLVILGCVALYRSLGRGEQRHPDDQDSARQILERDAEQRSSH